ncbi:unnamed protein product, partial [marine sediment metagenome]
AMKGKADISSGWLRPLLEKDGVKIVDFSKIEGREAGISRSNYLDKLYEKVHNFIDRYPSGCDVIMIKEREKNRKKILNYFGATIDNWKDYGWQLKHIFYNMNHLKILEKLVPLSDEDLEAIKIAIENKIPFGITPYYLSLFDFSRSDRKYDYQVRSQVIPPMYYVTLMKEHRKERSYYFDFMGEHDTSPEELITRRYPMISILKPYDTCPQICVYCQRNWEITGPMMPEGMVSKEALDKAFIKLKGAAKESIKEFRLLLANTLTSDNWAKGDNTLSVIATVFAPFFLAYSIISTVCRVYRGKVMPIIRSFSFILINLSKRSLTPKVMVVTFFKIKWRV